MDIRSILLSLQDTLSGELPKIMGAIVILIVGWLLAVIIKAGIRKALGMVKLNDYVNRNKDEKSKMDLEGGIATGSFWIVILITAIAIFEALEMELVSAPLNTLANQIFNYIPQLIGGVVLILVAWLVASGVKLLVNKSLSSTTLDERLSEEADIAPMSRNVANAMYWFIILLFLPAILGALQLGGLLDPVQAMVDKILSIIPNIFAAVVIGVVGWFVAKILRDLVTNLLLAAGTDKLGQKAGLKGDVSVSRLTGIVIFIFVFIPALIAALNALQIEAISRPATDMLAVVLNAIPNVFAAIVIIMVTYYVARLAASLVVNLLEGMDFNALPAKIGLADAFDSDLTASQLVGKILVFFAMLFATVEAAHRLGFVVVRDIVSTFIQFGGQVLLGSIILAVGVWLASLAHQGIMRVGGERSRAMAGLARIAILTLVAAMGLRSMGIADDIVNLAFGLTLGAVAIAIALSFGLGGREAAGKQMEYWLSKFRE
ncbi:MAG TPA: mechanosensitive ion channel [Gammaproteobacteria bacterium]|nr:mechanosensitive ion channel [Gammaproteobacteria bacterium]